MNLPRKFVIFGVFIFRIFVVKVGDKVLAVNGRSLVNVNHYTAVEVLRSAGSTLLMHVVRESPKRATIANVPVFNKVS